MKWMNEQVLAYLLGAMSETDADAFESEVFEDDRLYDKLLVCEDELVDAYVQGSLRHDDRLQFEAKYLATHEGRDRIATAHALYQRFHRPPGWVEWLESHVTRHGRRATQEQRPRR